MPLELETIQSHDPRETIVNASLEIFYRDGIRATDINQIIEKAGISKLSFYQNFQSKDDLVLAFLQQRHINWMGWFTREVEARLFNPGAGLEVIADVLHSWFEDPKFRGCAFINTVAEGGRSDSKPFVIAREHKEELKQFLKGVALKLNLDNPEMAASAAVLVIEGAIVRAQMTGDSREANTARLLFLCLNHS